MRKPSDIRAFEEMLGAGPMTLVIIYADWCGYCQRRKGEFNSLMNKAGPGMNVAMLNETMMPQTSVADAKINGYPSVILVGEDKKPAEFKSPEGEMTNALPKSDTPSLEQIISKANSSPSIPSTPSMNLKTPSMNLKTPSVDMELSQPTPATSISPISNNLIPSQPPDVLEDMVMSQKETRPTPVVGGASRPGLFKELEMMARNGKWAMRKVIGTTRRIGRSLKRRLSKKSKRTGRSKK